LIRFVPVFSLAQDYLNEIYGAKVAPGSVYGGFFGWFVGTLMMLWLLFFVPTPPDMMELTAKAQSVLGLVARVNLTAFVSYLLSSWLNVYIFDRMKQATQGKTGLHLWFRTVTATGAAQLVDSIIFVIGAFALVLPGSVLINILIANLIVKWANSLFGIFWLQPLVNAKRRKGSSHTVLPTEGAL
jgi:uncharacterized integral membrane protein (TIGR00697 family)